MLLLAVVLLSVPHVRCKREKNENTIVYTLDSRVFQQVVPENYHQHPEAAIHVDNLFLQSKHPYHQSDESKKVKVTERDQESDESKVRGAEIHLGSDGSKGKDHTRTTTATVLSEVDAQAQTSADMSEAEDETDVSYGPNVAQEVAKVIAHDVTTGLQDHLQDMFQERVQQTIDEKLGGMSKVLTSIQDEKIRKARQEAVEAADRADDEALMKAANKIKQASNMKHMIENDPTVQGKKQKDGSATEGENMEESSSVGNGDKSSDIEGKKSKGQPSQKRREQT